MKTTPDKIVRVAAEHIKLYDNRIKIKREERPGHQYINLEECLKYLRIWTSIANKGGQNLNAEEVNEVADAYDSGDYDKIFKETN